MKYVNIEKIKIKIGEISIELTPEQAKQLRDELNSLLGGYTYTNGSTWYPYVYTSPYNPNITVTWNEN